MANSLFENIRRMFRPSGEREELPLVHRAKIVEPQRSSILPWKRREAAMNNLQNGFSALADLMSGIRENLERSASRQDELLTYLAHLPEALQSIPENARAHGETLAAIRAQLEQQNGQQHRLAEILEKIGQSSKDHAESLGDVREHVESIRQTDEAISSHMSSLGAALHGVSRNSTTSAQVLEQMRDRIDSRDGQLERILHRQNTRFTAMLAIAIFLSVGALVAVSVIGYMLMVKR